MAVEMLSRESNNDGKVVLEHWWDTVSQRLIQLVYKNSSDVPAIMMVELPDGKTLDHPLEPTGGETRTRPIPGASRPNLAGVRVSMQWPAPAQDHPGKGR